MFDFVLPHKRDRSTGSAPTTSEFYRNTEHKPKYHI